MVFKKIIFRYKKIGYNINVLIIGRHVLSLQQVQDGGGLDLNILFAQILWHTWININSCQIDNMHSGKSIAVKLS